MTRQGLRLVHTVYDPATRRSRCGSCTRDLATGQAACVCGAQFVGSLSPARR